MIKSVTFSACLFTILSVFSSCKKDHTYTVDERDGVQYVHNLKPKHDKPIADLEFIRQIGELEPEDENYMFNFPISVAVDKDDNVFVLDSKESCIKKFNADGKYLTRFGRAGQGPGELEYPMTIDCRGVRLLVTSMASYFHFFDLGGKYIERIRLPQYQGLALKFMNADRVVGFSMQPGGDNTKENKILKIYDLRGNVLHDFGDPFLVESARSSWVANFFHITVDDKGNIFVAFSAQNRIEKYSDTGKLLMKIDRQLPFDLEYKYEKKKMEVRGTVREYVGEDFPQVSRGIGVDSKGRIWVQVLKKQIPKDIDIEDFVYQDYFEFEVYSEDGILLTKLPLPGEIERFDNWTMKNDRIFFADPYGQACVYVYKTVWK